MNTFQQLVTDLLQSDPTRDSLAEFMGWDVETGPSDNQMHAISVLMGWCPRSTSTEETVANFISAGILLSHFIANGVETKRDQLTEWHWNGWHAERWNNESVYFYNPVCQSTVADAYEFLVQI